MSKLQSLQRTRCSYRRIAHVADSIPRRRYACKVTKTAAANKSEFKPKTIIEPFRIKMVEPIALCSRAQREQYLEEAHYNLFKLPAENVTIDFLTDSGTSAMSQEQWSKLMLGDESYAYSKSWFKFERAVKSLTGKEYVYPVHQGRAAERLLFLSMLKNKWEDGEHSYIQQYVPGNTHFDTTRANIEYIGAKALDMVIAEGSDTHSEHPFKGNIDVDRLENFIKTKMKEFPNTDIREIVPLVVLTITNNSGGGTAVSIQNMYELREKIGDKYGIPLFLDCARFAENAYFIQQQETNQRHKSCKTIAIEFFKLFDGCLMSMKKDALANIGGFLALDDDVVSDKVKNMEILTEGYFTYGGLAGRDLEVLAQGLAEILDENYLEYRVRSVQYLFDMLDDANIPLLRPCGGHAIYLNALEFFSHLPAGDLPGQALSCALYTEAGIRTAEIGTVMFGRTDEQTGKQIPRDDGLDLVRLAIPRRVYTQSHIDYVIEAVKYVYKHKLDYGGYRIVKEPPFLRHFTCDFEPLDMKL